MKKNLDTIQFESRHEVRELISGIDKHFAEIVKGRGIDLPAQISVQEQASSTGKGQKAGEQSIEEALQRDYQPTVAQLAKDARSGKPVSLMDLLEAMNREEKQSVMKQPKAKPQQNKEISKIAPSRRVEMER